MASRRRKKRSKRVVEAPSIDVGGIDESRAQKWYGIIRVVGWAQNGKEICDLCTDVIRPVIEEKIARPRRSRKKEPRTVVRPLFYEYVAVATKRWDKLRACPGVIEIIMMGDEGEETPYLVLRDELMGMIESKAHLPDGVRIEFLEGHSLAGSTATVRGGRIVIDGRRNMTIRIFDPRFMRAVDKKEPSNV